MRYVVTGAILSTVTMVVGSHFDTAVQLASVLLASFMGGIIALHVFRSSRFEQISAWPVIGLAVILHILALFGKPLVEDDYYRYLWDAFRFVSDGTPYGRAPSAYFGDESIPAHFQEILNFINYPDIPTVYGPVLQAFFATAYSIAPGRIEPLQALNAAVTLTTLLILARFGAKPRWLLLYAISPLVFKEAVITAHPDALTGLLALAAFLVVGPASTWLAGTLLGFAVASKISVAILLPFLWKRGGVRAFSAAGLTLILCYAPFFLLAGSDAPSLAQFAQNWRFNPMLFAPIEWLTGPTLGRLFSGMLIVSMVAVLYWRDGRGGQAGNTKPLVPAADYALGALLIFSPVVNPWYLLWLLPFAVLRPTRTAWAATFLLPLSYWNGSNLSLGIGHEFDVPLTITFIEIIGLAWAVWLDVSKPLALAASGDGEK